MNSIKVLLYRLVLAYSWYFPINKGKSFLLRSAYKLLGDANFKIGNEVFSLSPISYIDKNLIKTGTFDERLLKIIKLTLGDGGIYLDIGANIGYYAILTAKLPGVKVIAIEPSPREFLRLQENIRLNKLNNISALKLAASDTPGKRVLHISDEWNTSMNSFNPAFKSDQPFKSKQVVEVECCRVDDIISTSDYKKLKLIKIDVEGAEFEVIKGMQQLLQNFDGVIICEITPGPSGEDSNHIKDIYNLLDAKGFKYINGLDFSSQYDEIFYKPGIMEEKLIGLK